jgi:carboxylate-amine ligase
MHTTSGTLELRAPDAQSSVADVHGVAAFAWGLMHDLAARHDAGEILAADDAWRIDENRWSAMRDGVDGTLADLRTGERRSTRELLLERIEQVGADEARPLVEANGALRQRAVAADAGVRGVAEWLAERF